MSFQHFRLGEMSLQQSLPPHLAATASSINGVSQSTSAQQTPFSADSSFSESNKISSSGHTKLPYGAGDTDDGYTLVFPNIAAFNEWREKEEETQMVEFVKGDTHGSKAVPPRFKDHTKLVCARHSRNGRKKYVKKHPERVRKVPSRKLEGQGCPASISYKTYFDSEEVRASYNSQHSHEIGLANLPFTRRGRRAAVEQDKRSRQREKQSEGDTPDVNGNVGTSPVTPTLSPASASAPPVMSSASSGLSHPPVVSSAPTVPTSYSSAVSMIAPLPQQTYPPQQQAYNYQHPYPYPPAPPPQPSDAFAHDRWQNMETLFHSVREHARTFTYPPASVAALENVLIRLFLESPTQVMQVAPAPVPPNSQSTSTHMTGMSGNEDASGSEDGS
ncbi:hypothetical protein K435DRAFT_959672 [Dendrothele bispora CBS 962.96]|uniref:Uncharacterized protein n=1 Tax=Dendrothele bispora (strain CBS 962.96) TaxID=1314807 RepID=A0A4S8MW93_DENBC|nr:hypothetical protein K435DRAFT_959672 [Dendrothele bispora CBS 962.96]